MDMRNYRRILTATLALGAAATLSYAGLRGPGKCCGVVIFDRWDACLLYSGVYVMYVSEGIKDALRDHAGEAVQIDATEVYQPLNPGEGLIKRFTYLGPAPAAANRDYLRLTGLTITCRAAFEDGARPAVLLEVANTDDSETEVFTEELAPTLLTRDATPPSPTACWDGPSYALITRQGFWNGADESPRWQGKGVANGKTFSWTLGQENALPRSFRLKPGEQRQVRLHFDLPPGEYDFLCGYGGGCHEGTCVPSNLVAFDVDEAARGKATPNRRA